MEPDHCAAIEDLILCYPNLTIVGNTKTLGLINQFSDLDLNGRTITVKENDTLSLGSHTLRFYLTLMVHWPEVMMTFEESEGLLFSADSFGSFGALNGNIFDDEIDFSRNWMDDCRRYYCNIVGKYGPQVQMALKKLSLFPIRIICPLHGPIWRKNPSLLIEKYERWSLYQPEESSAAIFYASMYGDTENAADIIAAGLAEAGVKHISVYDISFTHVSELIAEAFRCSHLVLASPTYNAGIYPATLTLLHDMKTLNLQNRTIALIENGSWTPASAKQVRSLLDEMKNMTILDPVISIRSSLKKETKDDLDKLVNTIIASM